MWRALGGALALLVVGAGVEALGQRFGLAPLIGRLANISGDLNEVDNIAEGVLKQLTGEDVLTIDRPEYYLGEAATLLGILVQIMGGPKPAGARAA